MIHMKIKAWKVTWKEKNPQMKTNQEQMVKPLPRPGEPTSVAQGRTSLEVKQKNVATTEAG